MSKVDIERDELYPFYSLVDPHYSVGTVEISDDMIVWVNRVMEEFGDVQDFLGRCVGDS